MRLPPGPQPPPSPARRVHSCEGRADRPEEPHADRYIHNSRSPAVARRPRCLSGLHPGFRPAHAKGLMCSGTFAPSPEAARTDPRPAREPAVHARDRALLGLDRRADDPRQRPGAVRPAGHRRPLPPGRPRPHRHRRPLHQRLPRPHRRGVPGVPPAAAAFGAGRPEALGAFLAAHPNAKRFVETPKPIPTSFAREAFFAVTAFKFTTPRRASAHGPVPHPARGGDRVPLDEDAAQKPPDFLFDEIGPRLAREAVPARRVRADGGARRRRGRRQRAVAGQPRGDSASAHHPDRPRGRPGARAAEDHLRPRPAGRRHRPSGDPLTQVRADIYLLSGRRRRAALGEARRH